MKKYVTVAALLAFVSALVCARLLPEKNSPGLQPYTPTRIEWLAVTLQAALREDATEEKPFMLNIVVLDSETVLIHVRYLPTVDRKVMNMSIDTARKVIHITASSFGWDDWVKIKEDVESAESLK